MQRICQPGVMVENRSREWIERGSVRAIPTLSIPGVPLVAESGASASQVCRAKTNEALENVSGQGLVIDSYRGNSYQPIILDHYMAIQQSNVYCRICCMIVLVPGKHLLTSVVHSQPFDG